MPKTSVERNNFVRGLITEANPLTFPENASIDEVNMVLNRDGSRQRRLGMDYEEGYALTNVAVGGAGFEALVVREYTWKNADNDPNNVVGVVQIGRTLYFLDLTATAPSAETIPTLTLSAGYDSSPIQFSPIKGVLVCTASAGDAFYIKRVSATSYTKTDIDLKVRDIWGVQEVPALDVDERPATLSDTHEYNLLNQGWDSGNWGPSSGIYVSNADIMQYGKDASDNFSRTWLDKQFFGTTPAPKGKYVIDAFSRGASRETVSGVTGLVADQETGRCTTVTTFAGRVFYSGVQSNITGEDTNSPFYAGTIFFTRIVDSLDKLEQCYQEADPTSEHVSDLIPTDGGTIEIPDAANIQKLVSTKTSLLVIAENGVWEITGPDGVFSADDFSITQVTNIGAINAGSVVNVEGNIFYWSDAGIYVLALDPSSGRFQAQNLTETTIQSLYISIPSLGKLYSKSTYDSASKKVRWLYNDTSSYNGNTLRSKYNKELVFDTVLQAFYINEIKELASESPFVAGYIPTTEFLYGTVEEPIVVNGDPVVVNGESVVVTVPALLSDTSKTKYLVFKPNSTYSFTLGFYNNGNFLDWEASDTVGVDANAYVVTGQELFNDSQRQKYTPYITTHMRRTETGFTSDAIGNLTPVGESGCLLQARWDFADSAAGGKWGSTIQIYRLTRSYIPSGAGDTFDYGQSVITTKNRLRGTGKALSLKFSSEAGKDLHLYGWGMVVTGDSSV